MAVLATLSHHSSGRAGRSSHCSCAASPGSERAARLGMNDMAEISKRRETPPCKPGVTRVILSSGAK